MINTNSLRAQFKRERQTMKDSNKNFDYFIIGVLLGVCTTIFALLVRAFCLGILTVHHIIK